MQVVRFVLGLGAGAALAYFLDPDRGRRRRAMARDRALSLARRGGRRAEKTARYLRGVGQGLAWRVRHPTPDIQKVPNDETLTRKVESVIFRDPDVPKGQINVNVEHGVVVLRGQVARPEQVTALEDKARAVPGILEVDNRLHLPHTPVPDAPPVVYD
jgi:osmotically-inducible protein OsmY